MNSIVASTNQATMSSRDIEQMLKALNANFGKKEQDVHHSVDDKPERPILEEMKRAWVMLGVSIANGERVDVPINQLKALLDDAQLTGIE